MKVLAIDPGTTNLGWVLMEDGEILDCGVDCIWKDQKDVFQTLTRATVGWFREKEHLFAEADLVRIEQQYQGKSLFQIFRPYVVMTSIFSCCEVTFPGKIATVSPAALKAYYQIKGSYDERKAQVVKLAGLSHLAGRVHDIADCVLMVYYEEAQQQTANEHKARQAATEARRQALRDKLAASVQIRDRSPQRPAKCKVCEKEVIKLCRGACRSCYQRAYRAKNKT